MLLERGKEYKVKFSWSKRAVRKIYEGDRHELDYNKNEYPNGIAIFGGVGGTVFAPYEDIISIVEVDQSKEKKKVEKVCPRCLGNKTFEHLKHVNGGRCFKCDGKGTV